MTTVPGRAGFLLLVEDDGDLRDSLAEVLRLSDFPVVTAANGREAQAVLQRLTLPCVVLLDLMMPVMSGWELCRWMRGVPALSGIPVVAMTGVANPAEEAVRAGAAAWITKPLDLTRLLATLTRLWPPAPGGPAGAPEPADHSPRPDPRNGACKSTTGRCPPDRPHSHVHAPIESEPARAPELAHPGSQ